MAPGTSRMRATISIGPRRFAGQLLIWSQNRLKSVKDVLLCLLTRTTLAHGSWHLKDARHDLDRPEALRRPAPHLESEPFEERQGRSPLPPHAYDPGSWLLAPQGCAP